ncbi:MAG: YtxH domain-containing protein [Thermodesulfovibrionales bacterium]|nr:YtxH domain-containing protein [Thermodesulfovibrionales bacterium]
MRDDNGYGAGSVLLSFLLGGAVGAGLALLLAPQSGPETRRKIKDFAEDMKERVGSTVEKGKDLFEQKKSVIASAIDAGKEAYEKERERLSKS